MSEPESIGQVLPRVLRHWANQIEAAGPLRGREAAAAGPERERVAYSPPATAKPERQGPEDAASEPEGEQAKRRPIRIDR